MCLIVFAYRAHPRYPLVVAANRDEFTDREAQPAHYWPDQPMILAGRDLKAKGTWLGITRAGRFAAVTNHRDLRRPLVQGPSRGLLVRDALLSDPPPDAVPMDGYNLIHGGLDVLRYRSNITGEDAAIAHGVHGLSNALLDTPWPKVLRAKAMLKDALAGDGPDPAALFRLLGDEQMAEARQLPDTGLDEARERALSSIRIAMPGYGTRCSTLLLVDDRGHARFHERTWATGHEVVEEFDL